MSTSEVTGGDAPGATAAGAGVAGSGRSRVGQSALEGAAAPAVTGLGLRFVASEIGLLFGRRRNLVLLAVLALAPIALGIAVDVASPSSPGQGPTFLSQITDNGLFLVFTSLVITLPLFLPLAVAVASGDAVAGEASSGTLRNLLVVPVGRTRLLVVKYVGIVVWAAACTFTVAVVGLVVGLVLFPHGSVTLLSGDTIGYGHALGRALLVTLYVIAMLAGIAAIGLFVSTLTEVPIAAMAAVIVLTIVSEIVDAIPQLAVVHPYLFTHPWLAFGDLLRAPILATGIDHGLLTELAYVVVFGALAWSRFTSKDITS